MAVDEANKTKLITLGGLAKFFEYLKQYLVEKAFSNTHFSKTKDSNYVPGTEGLIDVKLGRMVDDGVAYKEGSGNYNTILPTNSARFLTNGQTIVNVVNGVAKGHNTDNNKTLNKTGLDQTIPNTFGLTVSNSVFKARGAEIDWTNGRSWDTLNYFLSPGIYTINYKIPKSIPEDKKGSYDTFEKFLAAELGNSGFNGLNLPKTPGEVIQIRLTVTTIFVGSNKERLRVYQQAQIVTSKQDKLAGNLNFHDSGDVYVRIGEGPSALANFTDRPNIFFGATSSDYIFTSWRSITSSSVTKTYQPIKVTQNAEAENQYSRIKFQDGGVFTLTPIDYSREDGEYRSPLGEVRNHKQIDILLPDLSTMSTKKPQKCTLYVYNYSDVINQYVRLYIEQPKKLKAKSGGTEYEYLSHDVMCSVQLDRFVNQFKHRNEASHTRHWFTTVQWGQLGCWYNSPNDTSKKYRILRYAPHYERDYFSIPDQIWDRQTWDGGTKTTAYGGANGVYKIDITILHVDNMMPARNAKGEYIQNYDNPSILQRNFKVCTATKYYHILTSIEYLGPLDPTFNAHQNRFEGIYMNSKTSKESLKGISCFHDYVEVYNRKQLNSKLLHLDGSITDAEKKNPGDASYYKFALLEDWGVDSFVDDGATDYDKYRTGVEYNIPIENKK